MPAKKSGRGNLANFGDKRAAPFGAPKNPNAKKGPATLVPGVKGSGTRVAGGKTTTTRSPHGMRVTRTSGGAKKR